MANLLKLRQVLKENKPNYPFNYAIPSLWNLYNYQTLAKLQNKDI